MDKKLVIFGLGDAGELAYYYFKTDSKYDVVAFTVDREYLIENVFCGLPVVSFDKLSEDFPPDKFDIFIALGYSKLNKIRAEKYLQAKNKNYHIASYISSKATILNNNQIGENCFILEDNTIQPFVTIGNNVTLWSGNHIGHHTVIKDHNFIASHVVISGRVTIEESCFIGVNATIRNHITIGEKSVIGAGVLILNNVSPEGIYKGVDTKRADFLSSRLKNI